MWYNLSPPHSHFSTKDVVPHKSTLTAQIVQGKPHKTCRRRAIFSPGSWKLRRVTVESRQSLQRGEVSFIQVRVVTVSGTAQSSTTLRSNRFTYNSHLNSTPSNLRRLQIPTVARKSKELENVVQSIKQRITGEANRHLYTYTISEAGNE